MARFPARRTATSVLAGDFVPRPHPARDVLTSLLNGVPLYAEVEGDDDIRRAEKRERRRKLKEKRKAAAEGRARDRQLGLTSQTGEATSSFGHAATANASTSFWERPAIHIPTMRQRSVSVSPPPSPGVFPSSGASTPSPSESSSVTRSSSKRLRTPDDYDELLSSPSARSVGRAIKKRPAPRPKKVPAKKGWKGWVEADEEEVTPSEKLIVLDTPKVLEDRKTRSGKAFDAWL